MRYFITGTAGFIGFHLAKRLLDEGHTVTGYDGMTPYYDLRLKEARHTILRAFPRFTDVMAPLEDFATLSAAAQALNPDVIVHLAGQAGVRYSLEVPRAYVNSNLVGSFNVLEIARELGVKHLLLASSSSVYGLNDAMPFGETDKADHPITLYAASKKAMEELSHSYAHLWKIPTTCFRFFTVYGPWGRPDMALFKFVDAIIGDRAIDVYGGGDMKRDFTFIDDLVEAILRLSASIPVVGQSAGEVDSLSPVAPWRVVNIAGGQPVGLLSFIETIEAALSKKAIRNILPMQKGDVTTTFADHRLLEALTGFRPATGVDVGVPRFVDWYKDWLLGAGG